MENLHIYSRSIEVKQEHLDALLHVNNLQYLHWMMEAAEDHWQSRAPQELIQQYSWWVKQHQIEYLGQAMEGDRLTLKTWTGEFSGACWWRHYIIAHTDTNSTIAEAATQFVLVSRQSGKPQPIRTAILQIFQET